MISIEWSTMNWKRFLSALVCNSFCRPLYKSILNKGWRNEIKKYVKLNQDDFTASSRGENFCSYTFVKNKEKKNLTLKLEQSRNNCFSWRYMVNLHCSPPLMISYTQSERADSIAVGFQKPIPSARELIATGSSWWTLGSPKTWRKRNFWKQVFNRSTLSWSLQKQFWD